MNKSIKITTSICVAMCSVLVLFELPKFIFTSAMTEHEVSTMSKAIFIPLFIVGTLISAFMTIKKNNTTLAEVGLLFMGVLVISLAFFNVYNLQMLLPLVKTNSICTVVMWISRVLGGLVGIFCGFAFGSVLTKGFAQYVAFVIAGVAIFLLGLLAPDKLSYELLFYGVGIVTFVINLIFVFSKKNER